MGYLWMIAVLAGGVAATVFAATRFNRRRLRRAVAGREDAIQEFSQQRDDLTGLFLRTASASGKPRGLRWTGCELSGTPLFAADDATGELIALAAATISFAAIEGGGMEDVEAVGNLRSATAVFMHRGDGWITDGRVIFNLEPAEALAKFQGTLRPLG
ncbi:hypothetical protein [Lacipirellula limnantheis]|uniref:Uncharacterized protein n=1 Tax=Lacipirellula limnantheis TaxID=2528024 RepID=A0A517U0C9_9BACT|nr:hypothetical protein [Lacipirellula limnantheis]QDT74061.1 hypothetical protein I41_32550 [Lacipirellula limnantheis]